MAKDQGLDLVLGSDDPGIFSTNFEKELQVASNLGLNIQEMKRNSQKLINY